MFFTGRSKHLPYLSDYLESAARSRPSGFDATMPLALLAAAAMALFATLGVMISSGGVLLFAAIMGAVAVALGVFGAFGRGRRSRNPSAGERLREEAGEVTGLMHASLQRRRLHKDLHPAAAELLELAAWQWRRCRNLLESPYWRRDDLPSHWGAIRDQTSLAVSQAMYEVLVLLRDAHSFSPKKNVLEEVVEEVFEEFGGGKGKRVVQRFPVAFQPARQIVEQMQNLVNEFESATEDVAREEASSDQFSSAQTMDMVLNELRTIRHAEDELRQNLRG